MQVITQIDGQHVEVISVERDRPGSYRVTMKGSDRYDELADYEGRVTVTDSRGVRAFRVVPIQTDGYGAWVTVMALFASKL